MSLIADDQPPEPAAPNPQQPTPPQPPPPPEEPKDHRSDPRVAHAFMVRYRSPNGWLMSPLKDFSTKGARFVSEYPFTTGETIEVQLVLPTAGKQPVNVKARVAWMKPTQWGLVELGVTFETDNPEAKQVIETAVSHFLRKQERR